MILDMSQFMSVDQPIIDNNIFRPNQEHDLAYYQQIMIDPTDFPGPMVTIIRRKLLVLNYLIDRNSPHQYFIYNCYESTIFMSLQMCKFEYGDRQYLAMRECFLRLHADILYLLAADYPHKNLLHQNKEQFDDLINALKMVQALRQLKSTPKNPKYQKITEELTKKNRSILKKSFVFNVIIMTKEKSKLKKTLDEIREACKNRYVYFEVPEIYGCVHISSLTQLIHDSLLDIKLSNIKKIEIFKDLLKTLEL